MSFSDGFDTFEASSTGAWNGPCDPGLKLAGSISGTEFAFRNRSLFDSDLEEPLPFRPHFWWRNSSISRSVISCGKRPGGKRQRRHLCRDQL